MHCDSPAPAGGNVCPCDDPNAKNCTGLEAVIEEPCNEGPCEGKSCLNRKCICCLPFG